LNLLLNYPIKQTIFITQGWGTGGEWYRENGINVDGHNGFDFHCSHGQPIYAAHDGIVLDKHTDSMGGMGIDIRTKDAFEYKGESVYFKTRYWHLKGYADIGPGSPIKSGEVIGYGDNTGFSTGDHLHFGLKPLKKQLDGTFINLEPNNGYYGAIDPTPYFPNNDMLYVISNGEQFLINERLKLALSIGDEAELNILRENGLQGNPDSVSADYIKQFNVYPLVRKDRLKDILNF